MNQAYKVSMDSTEYFAGDRPVSDEADSVKLFVGQIPKDMYEDILYPFFQTYGQILELTIIRDKSSKLHRGCAFLTYAKKQSAINAIQALHDKVKLPTALNPLQIRPAESQSERENKIFVGMLPKTISELDLHDMFARYGQLKEIHIIRGPEGQSKGCAFVKFVDREAALLAIHEMNDSVPEGSTRPLVIKFADSKKANASADEFEDYWSNEQVGVNSSRKRHDQLPQHIAAFGIPNNVSLATAATSYGYPLSPVNPNHILNSQSYLNYPRPSPVGQPYVYFGGYYPTYDSQGVPLIQSPHSPIGNRPRSNSKGSLRKTGAPASVPQPKSQITMMDANTLSQIDTMNMPQISNQAEIHDDNSNRPAEGPVGANIFIYHLPRDLTDADLATLFAPFGNVISAKVYVDKRTAESKGFGFVSYDSPVSAESAIEAMNGFQIGSKRLKVQHKRTHNTRDPSFGVYDPVSARTQFGVDPHISQNSMSYPMLAPLSPQQQAEYARSLEEQQQQHMLNLYHQQILFQQQQQQQFQHQYVNPRIPPLVGETANLPKSNSVAMSSVSIRGNEIDDPPNPYELSTTFQNSLSFEEQDHRRS